MANALTRPGLSRDPYRRDQRHHLPVTGRRQRGTPLAEQNERLRDLVALLADSLEGLLAAPAPTERAQARYTLAKARLALRGRPVLSQPAQGAGRGA